MFSEFGFDLNCGLGHSGVIQLGWIPSWLVVGWNNVPLVSASIIPLVSASIIIDGGERRGERSREAGCKFIFDTRI